MRVAGRLAAEVLEMVQPLVRPGVTTGELDRICHDYIVNHQVAIPAPLITTDFRDQFAHRSMTWSATVFPLIPRN